MVTRRGVLAGGLATLLIHPSVAAAQTRVVVYKDASCGCCNGYIDRLAERGFAVTGKNVADAERVKRLMGVPSELASCHTAVIGRYVVEGHVPIDAVERLLAERPDITGIALPGMPAGSPGMNGVKTGPFTIYAITDEGPKVYMVI